MIAIGFSPVGDLSFYYSGSMSCWECTIMPEWFKYHHGISSLQWCAHGTWIVQAISVVDHPAFCGFCHWVSGSISVPGHPWLALACDLCSPGFRSGKVWNIARSLELLGISDSQWTWDCNIVVEHVTLHIFHRDIHEYLHGCPVLSTNGEFLKWCYLYF